MVQKWAKHAQRFRCHAFATRFDMAAMQPLIERELAGRAQITMLAATAHTGCGGNRRRAGKRSLRVVWERLIYQ
jgi:hypothetical protein